VTDAAIGATLRQWRHRGALTQAQIADALGVHRPTVSLVERGQQSLRVRDLDRWAAALNTTAEAVLSGARQRTGDG
jgi:transcriptional regulator with XRE-family HTH domain